MKAKKHLSDAIRKIWIPSDKWSIKSRRLQFGNTCSIIYVCARGLFAQRPFEPITRIMFSMGISHSTAGPIEKVFILISPRHVVWCASATRTWSHIGGTIKSCNKDMKPCVKHVFPTEVVTAINKSVFCHRFCIRKDQRRVWINPTIYTKTYN